MLLNRKLDWIVSSPSGIRIAKADHWTYTITNGYDGCYYLILPDGDKIIKFTSQFLAENYAEDDFVARFNSEAHRYRRVVKYVLVYLSVLAFCALVLVWSTRYL